jgi:natural product biosynthesis luciferase-like monooxygenase protein
VDFGIMFFSSADQQSDRGKYQLLIEAAKFADQNGFCCIWTPERHFHQFGGLFPNPALIKAALAVTTQNIQLRAGSLISPLHDTLRLAEEWSVVDNLSDGRVAISFGSGWNVDDFIFFPERYATRHAVMYEQIETFKKLWTGEPVTRLNSFGKEISVRVYPTPIQKEIPVWITSSGNTETFISAGKIGANILTHLIGQNIETLASKIQSYRQSRAENGFDPQQGRVSLMLHTYLGSDLDKVREQVRPHFREYLRSAISLEEKAALGGGVISGGHRIDPHDIPADVMEDLLDLTFERYFRHASLMGTPSDCKQLVRELIEIGVDEVACLIDFLPDRETILAGLSYLGELRSAFSSETIDRSIAEAINDFVEELT